MMPDDTPDFIPHEGVSPEMRAIMRRSAATPFPGQVPDFIPHLMAPPPVSQAPAVLRFLMSAGKTAAAGTLNSGPQMGFGSRPITDAESQAASRMSLKDIWKQAQNDPEAPLNKPMLGIPQSIAGGVQDFTNKATGSAEGAGSALMQLFMLYRGLKGAPEVGSPNAYAEQVQPLSGYKPAAPVSKNPYAASPTFKPMSGMPKYPAPEMPAAASPSEIRAASSPNPPRSNLTKNQQQLADFRARQQPEAAAEPVYDRSAPKAARTDLPASQAPTPELMKQIAEHNTIPELRGNIRNAKAAGDTAAVDKWTKELQFTANKYGLQHRIADDMATPSVERRVGRIRMGQSHEAGNSPADVQAALLKAGKNTPADVSTFQEQASQELFGKSFSELPKNDFAARLQATLHATKLQNLARGKK